MFISTIEHSWWGESNFHVVAILFKYTAAPERDLSTWDYISICVNMQNKGQESSQLESLVLVKNQFKEHHLKETWEEKGTISKLHELTKSH